MKNVHGPLTMKVNDDSQDTKYVTTQPVISRICIYVAIANNMGMGQTYTFYMILNKHHVPRRYFNKMFNK